MQTFHLIHTKVMFYHLGIALVTFLAKTNEFFSEKICQTLSGRNNPVIWQICLNRFKVIYRRTIVHVNCSHGLDDLEIIMNDHVLVMLMIWWTDYSSALLCSLQLHLNDKHLFQSYCCEETSVSCCVPIINPFLLLDIILTKKLSYICVL